MPNFFKSFYKEGLNTVCEFQTYVSTLIEKLGDVKRRQDEEKRQLKELASQLQKSPFLVDVEKVCTNFIDILKFIS